MTSGAFLTAPDLSDTYQAIAMSGVPLFWIWMIWSGVVLWRRGPRSAGRETTDAGAAEHPPSTPERVAAQLGAAFVQSRKRHPDHCRQGSATPCTRPRSRGTS